MADRTIKELAEEIGVSKTAINKKVTKEIRATYFSKIGNKFVINEEGQRIIRDLFSDSIENDDSKIDNRETQTANQESPTSKTKTQTSPTKSPTSETKSKTSTTETQTSETHRLSEFVLPETAVQIIADYRNQLEQKDKQLAELHKLLDQQQQLTLQANRQNEGLRLQLEAFEEEEGMSQPEPAIQKKWWQFWTKGN